MQSNRQFWEEQGEAWKPMNAKDKKKAEKKEPNVEEGVTEDAPLVVSSKATRREHQRGTCAPPAGRRRARRA
jgi:hypothetical protein